MNFRLGILIILGMAFYVFNTGAKDQNSESISDESENIK